MTREEAIIHIGTLRTVTKDIPKYSGKAIDEAVDMAIKALEQEPYEDAISRQVAIELVSTMYLGNDSNSNYRTDGDTGDTLVGKFQVIDGLSDLPPVTPHYTDAEIQKMQEMEQAEIQKAYELGKVSQSKTGHWTRVTDKTGHLVWECDCGWQQRFHTNYCPDCGKKMIEPQESEVES